MDLKNGTTVLFVRDILISKKFYSGILGFTIDLDFGKNVIYSNGLTIWEIQESHIIPSTLGNANISDRHSNRFEMCFETETLPKDFELLKNNNVTFVHEVHEEPWGQRTIRFLDPDNHLIEIGESMKQFLTRFLESGMSIDEVSRRTSVKVEDIRRLTGK